MSEASLAQDLASVFTLWEMVDVVQAAQERGVDYKQLIHDAVMDDLHR